MEGMNSNSRYSGKNVGVKELANWMEAKGYVKIVDISQWDHNGH